MPPHRCSWRSDRAVCHGTERAASERRAETQSPSRRPRQHPNFCPDFCRISRVSSLPALGGCRLSHNPSRASSPSPLTVTTYPRLTTLSLTTTLPVRSRLRDRSAPATTSCPGLPSRPARVRWSVARPCLRRPCGNCCACLPVPSIHSEIDLRKATRIFHVAFGGLLLPFF